MNIDTIRTYLSNLSPSSRIMEILAWYLLSLTLPADKHTQAFAELISGKDNSLFSDLLAKELDSSLTLLNRSSKRRLTNALKKRRCLKKGVPWTISLIIDSTLHRRSSKHIENSQKFNHGKGYVVGHQWTNIGFNIAGEYIPLPPIAFLTQEECLRRGVEYKTEHEKVAEFLRTFSFKQFGSSVSPSEVVVLLDAGYDNKKIQQTILKRGWDFNMSLKSDRTVSMKLKEWLRIDRYFEDGRRPWKSIRLRSYRGKRIFLCQYKMKQRVGYLKDVHRQVKLVCSKRSKDTKAKHLACSNLSISPKLIILIYKLRWKIEIFHREIKSYLGLEDAGVKKFQSLHNHVHFVYLAYNLLKEKFPDQGIKSSQLKLMSEMKIREGKKSLRVLSLIQGKEKLKCQIRSDIESAKILLAS